MCAHSCTKNQAHKIAIPCLPKLSVIFEEPRHQNPALFLGFHDITAIDCTWIISWAGCLTTFAVQKENNWNSPSSCSCSCHTHAAFLAALCWGPSSFVQSLQLIQHLISPYILGQDKKRGWKYPLAWGCIDLAAKPKGKKLLLRALLRASKSSQEGTAFVYHTLLG